MRKTDVYAITLAVNLLISFRLHRRPRKTALASNALGSDAKAGRPVKGWNSPDIYNLATVMKCILGTLPKEHSLLTLQQGDRNAFLTTILPGVACIRNCNRILVVLAL